MSFTSRENNKDYPVGTLNIWAHTQIPKGCVSQRDLEEAERTYSGHKKLHSGVTRALKDFWCPQSCGEGGMRLGRSWGEGWMPYEDQEHKSSLAVKSDLYSLEWERASHFLRDVVTLFCLF